MNIKEFLIDNYIWIIVIILITIITIIGFLADKKKGEKKNKELSVSNPNLNDAQSINNMGPIQYQSPIEQMQNQMNNNMGMNFNNNINSGPMEPINTINNMQNIQTLGNINNMNMMQPEQPIISTIPTGVNQINNPQIVENITPITPQEPMYQQLSEQSPVIQSQPISNLSNIQNNQGITPVIDNALNQNMINAIPKPTFIQQSNESTMPIQEIQQTFGQGVVQSPNYNIQPQIHQPVENNSFLNIPNVNQNNITIPQPVNSQPIIQDTINVGQISQPNFGGPTTQTMNQSTPHNINQPINFVYGPQNNNQNM